MMEMMFRKNCQKAIQGLGVDNIVRLRKKSSLLLDGVSEVKINIVINFF